MRGAMRLGVDKTRRWAAAHLEAGLGRVRLCGLDMVAFSSGLAASFSYGRRQLLKAAMTRLTISIYLYRQPFPVINLG